MYKSTLSRIGGWGLILSGLIFLLYLLVTFALAEGFRWYTTYGLLSFILVPLLIMFGLFGLWARYGEHVGWLGRNILLAGALLAPLAAYLFFSSGILIAGMALGAFYYGAIPALTLGQICLAIFGIAALKHKPLPMMNWLPLAAGAWFPVVYPLHFLVPLKVIAFNGGVFYAPNVVDVVIYTGACAQAVSMMLLGYIVQRNHPPERSAT
jgi:hypothetical protein